MRDRQPVAAHAEIRSSITGAPLDRGDLAATAADPPRRLAITGEAQVLGAVRALAGSDRFHLLAAPTLARRTPRAISTRATEPRSTPGARARELGSAATVIADASRAGVPITALTDDHAAIG
jgi:hypothetical protein